jgi:hypothetical protein
MTFFYVTAVRIGDEGHVEECLISDVVRNADGFAIENARPMAALNVVDLIVAGDEVLVWNDDGNGGSTQDEKVTVLPGQIERLDSLPGHLIFGLPQL